MIPYDEIVDGNIQVFSEANGMNVWVPGMNTYITFQATRVKFKHDYNNNNLKIRFVFYYRIFIY
jgi:hypothetical protein